VFFGVSSLMAQNQEGSVAIANAIQPVVGPTMSKYESCLLTSKNVGLDMKVAAKNCRQVTNDILNASVGMSKWSSKAGQTHITVDDNSYGYGYGSRSRTIVVQPTYQTPIASRTSVRTPTYHVPNCSNPQDPACASKAKEESKP
jgi:hypothetical protein